MSRATKAADGIEIRDRIKELRCVGASELLPNPKNWRRSKAQADALRGLPSEVGYAERPERSRDARWAPPTDRGVPSRRSPRRRLRRVGRWRPFQSGNWWRPSVDES
jgi:hypothetical protein